MNSILPTLDAEAQRVDTPEVRRSRDNYGDSSGKLWSMYIAEAEKEDKEITEAWKGEADSILVFTGLFSATVAAFIIESYKKLSPDTGTTTISLLSQISQQLAGVSPENLPQNLTASINASFEPTTSAVRVNVLWFLSLVLSLTSALSATLVQQWARRYLELTQRRGAPHKRARIRAYLFDGVQGTSMYQAVEAMPLLLHISVFLFLAGLVEFLFPINKTVAVSILGYTAAFISVYMILTVLPNLVLNCPYRTPLSGFAWRITQFSALTILLLTREIEGALHEILLSLWHRTNRGLTGLRWPRPTRWRDTLEARIRTRRKWLANGIRGSVVLNATGAPWKVDARALHWTLTVLDGDDEIEDFVARIPGFFESPTSPDATSAILALMDTPSKNSDPILGSRIHDLLKTCEPGFSPLLEDARRTRLRMCLTSLWYCGRGYNQPSYSAPLSSYVRRVFAVPEMILQIRAEEDISVRLIGRCFESFVAKKLAQDVIDHPTRYSPTSGEVMDWLGQRGAISLAIIISLVASEADFLLANKVPSEALDVLQKTLEILVKELPHPGSDLSPDLAVHFCQLYSKVDNTWGTIWLMYQLRPIHERLLETNSIYSSAWSQLQASHSHQRGAGTAPWAMNHIPSGTGILSANRRALSNEIAILPPSDPSDDMSSNDHASIVSLFQLPTVQTAAPAMVSSEDSEIELIPLAPHEQEEAETATIPTPIPGLSTGIPPGTGPTTGVTASVLDNGRP
ncbi:hypothetical protein BC826DRAFT_87947 [Russula brevipes]|nr:hypothetical protein BC826DRAFT_87947 [Russula brevipes]